MSSFDDDAVLRYILEHVKSIVQNEEDGMPFARVQRQLAQLPPQTLGRFQPTMDTVRLAADKFPGAISIHLDGSVHSCAKKNTTSRTAPPVSNAAKPPVKVTTNSGSSDRTIAEGRITAVKERNYGFIMTHRPVQYNVFYHLSATSGWPPGSGGPKVGDPVEIEFERSPPGHKCRYIANVVRYTGSTPADAKEPRRPDDKRMISDQVGVITFIQPEHGIIKFGDGDSESAFFDKKSMPKQLLRRGETLMDVFSAGEKVCFEAQPNLKSDRLGEWYATAVSTVQRGGGTVVFNDSDFVCYAEAKSASDQRAQKLEPPRAGVASQQTQSGCWDGAEHVANKKRQSQTAPQDISFEVQRPRNQNIFTPDSSMAHTRDQPSSEAQLPERRSQRLLEASVSSQQQHSVPSQERLETATETPGGRGAQVGDCRFDVRTARQLAAVIESRLLEMFKEELTLVLSEELGLTAADLQMLNEELNCRDTQ